MATNDKYDRQLRLWGVHGQKALMDAHILLVNADGVGTETMKNLVLPGVGNFTVIDDKIVTELDLGNNFFVEPTSLGRPRAEVVTELLCEMNPDVNGFAISDSLKNIMDNDSNFLSKFSLVISANLIEADAINLSRACSDLNLPLIMTRSYGLIGSCRLQFSNHCIIESKPDGDQTDLRLVNYFDELYDYCMSLKMNEMDYTTHSNIPYSVVLFQLLEQWKQSHDNKIPISATDKQLFRKLIQSTTAEFKKKLQKTDLEGNELTIENEKNFEEAERDAFKAWTIKEIPYDVTELLEKQASKVLTNESKTFDILIKALQIFLSNKNDNTYPLSGLIPDMSASSVFYIQIQNIYKAKGTKDRMEMRNIIDELVIGLTCLPISDFTIDLFCHNICNLKSISTSKVYEELNLLDKDRFDNCLYFDTDNSNQAEQNPVLWYIAMRAADKFYSKKLHYPGIFNESLESDADEVWNEIQNLIISNDLNPIDNLNKNHAIEITRYGGCEIHSVSSFIGGVSAQETVKILTNQFIPMNNTFIYNGVAGIAAKYEF